MALTDNLISYWKLDADNSTQVDSAGSDDGSVNGATYTGSGKISGAYSFDGSNDYIATTSGSGSPLNITGNMSLACWIKTSGDVEVILGFGNGATGTTGYIFTVGVATNNKITFINNGNWRASNTDVNDDTWKHVGISLSGSTVTFYLNGSSDGTGAVGTGASWTGSRNIGASNAPATWFSGEIDEIGVWDRALTGAEFSELYNSGSGLAYPFGLNLQLNIGDTWKAVASMKINIGDTWKEVSVIKQNIGDAWKTV